MDDPAARATQEAVVVPAAMPGSVDVLLDGRRVWSFAPAASRQQPAADGSISVDWPTALHPFLDGRAEVTLRHHQEQRELFRGEVVFGAGEGRVSVVDDAGRAMAVTKYGRLNHPFESLPEESKEDYLDRVEEVLEVLQECGVQGYAAWGTLLGAVRSGRMIGHDVDADVGYLSAAESPADVVLESFRVERALRGRGWQVTRENGGFLAVFFTQPDGVRRNLDVFAGWIVDDWFYQVHDLRARVPRSEIEPLGTVVLEGRTLPAPRNPEAWLRAGYGEGWATPDPAFSFPRRRALRRRMAGWLGGLRGRRDTWSQSYAGSTTVPDEPSDFARWVAQHDDERLLVDVGCGRGGDALWFARNDREVRGVDVVPSVLRRAARVAEDQGLLARFEETNLADLRHALLLGTELARAGPVTVYGRRIVGDMRPEVEANFWRTVEMATRAGGRLFLEFVSEPVGRDDPRLTGPPVLGAEPQRVIDEVTRRGGRVVTHEQFSEPVDPAGAQVCRVMAEWSR